MMDGSGAAPNHGAKQIRLVVEISAAMPAFTARNMAALHKGQSSAEITTATPDNSALARVVANPLVRLTAGNTTASAERSAGTVGGHALLKVLSTVAPRTKPPAKRAEPAGSPPLTWAR